MTDDIYCPMIHGGLNINYIHNKGVLGFNHCCLSTAPLVSIEEENIWSNKTFIPLRQANKDNVWDDGCWECRQLEASGSSSFRLGMLDKFGKKESLTGPQRIDLLFDRSCNLACRICGPYSSTLWQQQLQQNNLPTIEINTNSDANNVIDKLKTLDLSNVEMIQFCGGETLLGNTYWKTAEAIAKLIPDAHKKITLGFQTNGTQSVDPKYYELIEKFHLVKFIISIDGIGERFNYLRWPGDWNQVSDNILQLKENLPVNVMFIIQETLCNFNLLYTDEVLQWVQSNFSTNRLGDITNHSRQLAIHDFLSIDTITEEYVAALANKETLRMLPPDWRENPEKIKTMLRETAIHDKIRNQDWRRVFPEVAEYYSRYL